MSISWEGEEAGGERFEASNKTIVHTDDPTSSSSNSAKWRGGYLGRKRKHNREKERERVSEREKERGRETQRTRER